jgi:hypothetical protein
MENNMSFRKRILTILNGEKPDKIPFFSFSELIPPGHFERKMRNLGMGFILLSSPLLSFTPNVSITRKASKTGIEEIYLTPKGDISFEAYTGTERISSPMWEVKSKFFIKKADDYAPLIYMIEDTEFRQDLSEFNLKNIDLGEDGVSHIVGPEPAYTEAELLLGLEKWSFEQYDNPVLFNRLLGALEKRSEKQLNIFSKINYSGLQHVGDISDNISPENYIKYEVPHYKKVLSILKSKEKKLGIHAHAKFLKRHKNWLAEVRPDYIESYTPPPYSDISLPELRKAVGEKVSILINFPETVFYQGYDRTKKYTLQLLESDNSYNKAIGFSEMGMMGVNGKNREIFESGFMAVAEAVNEIKV